MEMPKDKLSRCRHAHLDGFPMKPEDIKFYCTRNGIMDDQIIHGINAEQCEQCEHFHSKFIEYPITINGIDIDQDTSSLRKTDIGKFAKVRPCEKECENKTYVGIFLGDLPHAPYISLDEKSGMLKIRPMMNPAIYVPDLKKIVYGYESWWCIIEDEKDLDKEITDDLINNQWYVKAMKAMSGGNTDDQV